MITKLITLLPIHVSIHVLLISTQINCTFGVDRSKFRTCDQTSFCRRHRRRPPLAKYRAILDTKNEHNEGEDPYIRGATTASLSFQLVPEYRHVTMSVAQELMMKVYFLQSGVTRVRITNKYENAKVRPTYDAEVLNEDEIVSAEDVRLISVESWMLPDEDENENILVYSYAGGRYAFLIRMEPKLEMYLLNIELREVLTAVNTQQMFYFEHHRDKSEQRIAMEQQQEHQQPQNNHHHNNHHKKDQHAGKKIVGYWEDGLAIYEDGTREEKRSVEELFVGDDADGMWEENFSGHVDSKPLGPASVGFDIAFPNSNHLFGLPEHASSTQLKATIGNDAHYSEPYRLYNLDVFEYELDETMALYGAVPLVVAHTTKSTVGAFFFNPTETFVDVSEYKGLGSEGMSTHWMSESGVFDLFLLPGPSPREMYHQYATLTGRQSLPPMFALGYHQCRWNYRDEMDVYNVHQKFEDYDYPYDVLWLDIEHTDDKRYFTWNKDLFPSPIEMQEHLSRQGRKMVTIVDPHIKRDNKYRIHSEATRKGYYIKKNDGKSDFDGWCWPGSSSYLDFTDERVRRWWSEQFSYDKYIGSTPSLFTWNDMNEPSVFNGPEVSMQKDLLNLAGIEHREWHNLYGMLFHRATSEGLIIRNENMNERPFVLSRSFFAGSQRYGAIWTGDNESSWEHLKISAPMLLSLNIGGLSFVGADVGGFFGNPDAELMTRWMQAGAYQPFFRGHAHHDSKRREPWMFGDETLALLRQAAAARYALLPYWYTIFYEAMTTGMPVMRTMWMEFPTDTKGFSLDDQWMIGSDLLVKPITTAGANQDSYMGVYFPSSNIWYDVDTLQRKNPDVETGIDTISCSIDKIPVFQRGGSIILRKLRLRRSTESMGIDPYTIYVALDSIGKSEGRLYIDDEHSFDYQSGNNGISSLRLDSRVLTNNYEGNFNFDGGEIERIVLMGVAKAPKEIVLDSTVSSSSHLVFAYDTDAHVITIRKPGVFVTENWAIELHYE